MKPYLIASAAVAVLVPTIAHAQELQGEKYLRETMPAPSQAFELSVGTGYTQGFGELESGVGIPDVAGAGIGFDLAAGYRVNPHLGLSLGGQYHELNPANNLAGSRGMAFTAAGQFHIAPTSRLDPFLELGAGYRMLWADARDAGPTVFTHGLQLARARVGVDVRVSPDVAIAPVVGADANLFLWRDAGLGNTTLSSAAFSTFIFAGLQGRFDMGGIHEGTTSVTSGEPMLPE